MILRSAYVLSLFRASASHLRNHQLLTVEHFNGQQRTLIRLYGLADYCPFDISWKDVFCLAFYFKWKYFVLTDHILSETICLFYFCVLFSNIYTKIKFTAKNWSDLCNFCSKVIFFIFVLVNIFYFSLLNLNYWCFTTILWKFQKNWTSETC